MSARALINVFQLFDGRIPNDFSFKEFQETFDQFFDISDFCEIHTTKVEDETYISLQGLVVNGLNQKELSNHISTISKSIVEKNNINTKIKTQIDVDDVLIQSLEFNQHTIFDSNEAKTKIIVNYCIENVEVVEKDQSAYKRIFHATRHYLQENMAANKVKKLDLTPFINMSDNDFKVLKKSKVIESDLLKQIEKVRKANKNT